MLVCSLSVKSTKRLAHDVIDTFATHVDLVHNAVGLKMAALTVMFSCLSNVDL